MKKLFTFIAAALFSVAMQAQTVVGSEDNSTGWWTAFSPYYSIPANSTLSLNFVNYSSQANNWNNWLVVLTNDTERGAADYAEYCVLRADNWAWNSQTNSGDNQDWFVSLASNYNWDTFKADMDGSTVAMTVTREGAKTTIHADITTAGGASYFEDFVINCGDGTQPMGAFLSTEGGHLVINSATVSAPAQPGASESYKAINVAEDGTISMAPEFLAVVGEDGKTANNVADGKSIVTIQTDNVTVEAVGGTTPANIEGGAQDITPGQLIDEATHTYQVASVGSWNNVEWKNGNNKTDINDAAGTKLYFLMGTGNPYVGLNAEEIYTDDNPTGTYRAKYDFYEPDGSKGMPLTGLYYKFTTKQDGDLKVQIWANKGNRQTFVVDESTKQPVPYTVEGYVNGQKANDESKPVYNEDGTPKLDNDGNPVYEQYCIFFTNEELQERHAQSGNADNPYIIDMGNQAFWGWLTFHAEANKSYWLFQHSSQVGFGGFEFNGGTTAIQTIAAPKAAKSDRTYNLQGQVVDQNYKGIVIKNGRKYIRK